MKSIFDDNFLQQIENIFNKQAQDAASAFNQDLALKMIDDLQNQNAPPSVRTKKPTAEAQPTRSDLASVDAFINYIAKNDFAHGAAPNTTSGISIVVPATQDQKANEGYVKYQSENPKGFFQVNVNGLVDTLKYFESAATKSNNVYLQELISNLTASVKSNKQLNLSQNVFEKKTEQVATSDWELDDKLPLDTKLSLNINFKVPTFGNETVFVKDFRDDTSFNSFAQKFTLSSDGINFEKIDTNNICLFLHFLNNRASRLNPTEKGTVFYKKRLEFFMGKNSCPINIPEEISQGANQQALQDGTAASIIGKNQASFPFSDDNVIQIPLIKEFVSDVAQLHAKSNSFVKELGARSATVGTLILNVNNALNNWYRASTPQAKNGGFSMDTNLDSFVQVYAQVSNAPSYQKARDMFVVLTTLVQSVADLMATLASSRTFLTIATLPDIQEQVRRGNYYRNQCLLFVRDIDNKLRGT